MASWRRCKRRWLWVCAATGLFAVIEMALAQIAPVPGYMAGSIIPIPPREPLGWVGFILMEFIAATIFMWTLFFVMDSAVWFRLTAKKQDGRLTVLIFAATLVGLVVYGGRRPATVAALVGMGVGSLVIAWLAVGTISMGLDAIRWVYRALRRRGP